MLNIKYKNTVIQGRNYFVKITIISQFSTFATRRGGVPGEADEGREGEEGVGVEDAIESSDVDGSGAAVGGRDGGRGSAAEDGGGGSAVHEVAWEITRVLYFTIYAKS